MKKIWGLLSIFTLPFFVFGQNIDINEDTFTTTNITTNKSNSTEETKNNKLGDIYFGFCNEGKDNLSTNLKYAVNIAQPFNICAWFYNSSDQDIKIEIRIVDQALNNRGEATCTYASTNIQNFITDPNTISELKEIILPAGETLIKEIELMFPIGIEGKQSACFTYNVIKEENNNINGAGGGITAIINKAYLMDFFVGSLNDIKNEIIVKDITTNLNSNKELELSFNLENIGNLENKVNIKGQVTNIFGFKKDFTIEGSGIQLVPGRTVPVSANLGSIPLYGGLFNIKFTMTATPFFSYDISKSNIDPSLLEEQIFNASTMFFQMPWMIFALVAMFIIILYLLFRKPKKA